MAAANMSSTPGLSVSVDPTGAYVAPQAATSTASPSFTRVVGQTTIVTTTVTVGTTATVLAAARTGRGSVKVTQIGTTEVFIGPAGVTTANGDLLVGTRGAANTYGYAGALSGIVATGTQEVRVVEIY